jgi:hypothetical protein
MVAPVRGRQKVSHHPHGNSRDVCHVDAVLHKRLGNEASHSGVACPSRAPNGTLSKTFLNREKALIRSTHAQGMPALNRTSHSEATGLPRESLHAEPARQISRVSCLAPLRRGGRYIYRETSAHEMIFTSYRLLPIALIVNSEGVDTHQFGSHRFLYIRFYPTLALLNLICVFLLY